MIITRNPKVIWEKAASLEGFLCTADGALSLCYTVLPHFPQKCIPYLGDQDPVCPEARFFGST